MLLFTSCQLGTLDLPPRDCHATANVLVRGRVRDGNTRQPIGGAEILIKSTVPTSKCPNYRPIQDLKLATDSQGQFKGVIPIMHEADNAEIIISAPGYQPYRKFALTDTDLRINLYKQLTPTPGL